MKQLMTTKITDPFKCDITHEKLEKVLTYDIEEIDAQIKWDISKIECGSDSVEFEFEFWGLTLSMTAFDIDRQKYIYIDEQIASTDILDWSYDYDELHGLGRCNGIANIEIDFINQKISFINY